MSLVSVNLPSDGTTADTSDYNTPIQTIVSAINGNLDSTNLADGAVTTAKLSSSLGTALAGGYQALNYTPDTVTYNGNRSYSLVFNSNDLTSVLSPGMRWRTTRTVQAPTRCTSLNGSTQYYSKTTPAGMTFTDDFVAGAWVKLSSYAAGGIISRYNGTSGWILQTTAAGQIQLLGFNGAGANNSYVLSYQSIPLNKWVHIAAQLDMSAFTATTTTSYIMIDGVDVPCTVVRGGTNPTALVQAGNLEVGSWAGANFLPGKIAQAFVTSAKVTQANVRTIYSQGITATDITNLSIVSAYSFDNSINDLNTTNANNLTANGSAVATSADSPFGGQAGGAISSTLDYGIIQSVTFSANTTVVVQVPEGCTIPTSGGISTVNYSSSKAPYGFPATKEKWRINCTTYANRTGNYAALNTWTDTSAWLTVPIGEWKVGIQGTFAMSSTAAGILSAFYVLTGTTPTNAIYSYPLLARLFNGASVANLGQDTYKDTGASLSSQTIYKLYAATDTAPGTITWGLRGDQGPPELFAENAYL